MNELIARLVACGAPADLVADVTVALVRGQEAIGKLEGRRAKDRERKAVDALPRNSMENSEIPGNDGIPAAKEIPPDPHKKITPPETPKGVTPRPSRLPDDFEVPNEWIEWAIAKRSWSRPEAVEEGECFCRYWQAKGRDAAKRSWKKTWQNWVVSSRRPATPGASINARRPMNAEQLRAGIRFAEDNQDPDRAAELKRQLAALTTKPPDPKIAHLVRGVTDQLRVRA